VASPNKKLDPKGTGATPSGEGVLANFFNSLLYKKTGVQPGSPGTPSIGASPMKLGMYNNVHITSLFTTGILKKMVSCFRCYTGGQSDDV